jgi:DNA-directed RNA polymerase sigma subunit (sigma70/sigma32)
VATNDVEAADIQFRLSTARTLDEISRTTGVTRERVRQINSQAHRTLRNLPRGALGEQVLGEAAAIG